MVDGLSWVFPRLVSHSTQRGDGEMVENGSGAACPCFLLRARLGIPTSLPQCRRAACTNICAALGCVLQDQLDQHLPQFQQPHDQARPSQTSELAALGSAVQVAGCCIPFRAILRVQLSYGR